ncbi:MAG: MATE family efflux transporter [Acidimicrobiales bacterium]|nr:MATE family efflux transporter [Acidimicrobiales bacterium]
MVPRGAHRQTDREILRLALPALGALVAEPLYLLADTAVIGRLGTPQLDGFAIASQPLVIFVAVFIFLAYGTTAAVSRLLGAGEEREAATQAVQSLWLAAGLGIVMAVIGWLTSDPLLRILGGELAAEGPVADYARTYLRISLFGLPFMLIMLSGVGYLRGLQDTTRPLLVAAGTAALNLVLELVLIFGFDQGIGASALSTVIAQAVGAGFYLWWITRAVQRHHTSLRPDLGVLANLAIAGRDLFFRTAALRGSFTVATAVAARLGPIDLAAHEVTFQIWAFLAFVQDAIAIAGQAMIGRFLGAGDRDQARRVARRMVQWGLAAGTISALLVLALKPWLPGVFSTDEAVVSLSGFLLWHLAVSQPINGVVFTLDGILIGAGDLGWLARAMWISAVVFVPLCLVVLLFDAGVGWVWAALIVFMAVRLATLWTRYRTDAWLKLGAGL